MMPPAGNLPRPSSEISPAGVEPAEVSGLVASSGFFASCTATRGGVTGRPFADPYKRRSNFQWGAKWKLPLSKLKTKQLKGTRQAKETRKVGKRGLRAGYYQSFKEKEREGRLKGRNNSHAGSFGPCSAFRTNGKSTSLQTTLSRAQPDSKAQTPCFLVEAGR